MHSINPSNELAPIVYWDGSWCQKGEVYIPINDRAVLFGDGLFTTLSVREGKVEGWKRHLQRLQQQAEQINLEWKPIDSKLVEQLVKVNQAERGVWRLKMMMTASGGPSVNLPARSVGHLYMELNSYEPPQKALHLGIYPEPVVSPLSRLKSLAYLERLWLKQWALSQGYDDVVLTSADRFVTEASTSALFWLVDETFYYPDETLPRLPSIALEVFCEVAKGIGMQVAKICCRVEEIPSDAALFICTALMPLCPIASCGSAVFSVDWESAEQLRRAYLKQVGGISVIDLDL